MNYYDNVIELSDIKKIDKLNRLTNLETFHDDVRRLTKRVYSDHSIRRWECLAEIRYAELCRKARVCPWCGAKLKANITYWFDATLEICGKCFAEYGKRNGHITESEFYALLAKEENNETV